LAEGRNKVNDDTSVRELRTNGDKLQEDDTRVQEPERRHECPIARTTTRALLRGRELS
jgi:hypothetical protein